MNRIKQFLHNLLGWGFPDKKVSGDHFQTNYTCKFCDLEITKDSQGNWFHLSEKIENYHIHEGFCAPDCVDMPKIK